MIVLVGYAGAHGSTLSIAERIAAALTGRGIRVDVRPMDTVENAGMYGAFVLGSAVHDQKWLTAATDFVLGNRDALGRRPVWAFSVGTPAALRGPWRRMAGREAANISASLQESVRLRGHRLFSGIIRREHLSFAGNLIFRVMGCRYGDYRDWEAIDAWASGIVRELAEGDRPEAGRSTAAREDP
ncbi:flavodoxin domain-containing protein [Actinomadura vinacea]|uniref:Flavodoxin domain-containing protein n=1 Tax=Actinomadura vinacea TaxID=115336 RepID=A0ABN3JR89_9ACTN